MSRVIIDVCHPTDVHFFRHIISHLMQRKHEVLVTTRPKDVTLQLLEEFHIPFEVLGRHYTSLAGKALGLLSRDRLMWRKIKGFRPHIVMGFASPYAAQMAWLSKVPCITFNDTERAFWGNNATHPFTQYLVYPEFAAFHSKKEGLRFNGIFEQFYLSDRFFTPDENIKNRMDLAPDDNYIIMRMVAWNAAHDLYPHYLSTELKKKLIATLSHHGKVFISSEGPVPKDLKPYLLPTPPSLFHHVIASSSLCMSEGAKTASEAAILGIPSILMNSANLGYLNELARVGLLDIEPHPEKALSIALDYLHMSNHRNWQEKRGQKRDSFWNSTADVPKTILEFIDTVV